MVSVEAVAENTAQPTVAGSKQSIVLLTCTALAVVFSLVAVLVLSIIGLPWWLGILLGLVAGCFATLALINNVEEPLIHSVGAVEIVPGSEDRRILNLVEGLSLSSGISEPNVYLVHDGAMNAAALAEGDSSSILVTVGLLENLSRIELEGVVAELVTRIKSGDAEVATLSSAIFGRLITGPLSPVTRGLGVQLLNQQYVPDRDLISDGAAVLLTRYPPGLSRALSKIGGSSSGSGISGTLTTYDSVWLVSSTIDTAERVYTRASDLDLRVAVLSEL